MPPEPHKRPPRLIEGWLQRAAARRQAATVTLHLLATAAGYGLAFGLRFDFAVPDNYLFIFLATLPILLICRGLGFWYFGAYRGSWRHGSINDVVRALKACVAGSAIFLVILWLWLGHHLGGMPRSVFILEIVLTFLILAGLRVVVRSYSERLTLTQDGKGLKNTLVVGSGDRAVNVARFFMAETSLGMRLVGFLDDDPRKAGMLLLGSRVLGGTGDLERVVKGQAVDLVLILAPGATFKRIQDLSADCRRLGVAFRVLRSADEVLAQPRLGATEIDPGQVMRREAVSFGGGDGEERRSSQAGKVVLVSGAAGSIGSELARQLATTSPRLLLLLDQNESGLYEIQQELGRRAPEVATRVLLADLADGEKIDWLVRTHRPEIIYHAAAYKHVPMMEDEPSEALRVNVLGSLNLARAAAGAAAERFVYISTDKAVNPVSVMGMSKLMGERLVLSLNGATKFMAVRFGNVINSNGSVVPLFRHQVEEGGPVTVTHPEVSRYFMATQEAVNLVMAAGDLGRGGEVFLLDMGQPVKIVDVARQVIRLAGLEPGVDVEIVFTGLRPGEKLHEELFWEGEGVEDTPHPFIKSTRPAPMAPEATREWEGRSREAAQDWQGASAQALLQRFVAQEGGSPHS